jgi:hypothetical protein
MAAGYRMAGHLQRTSVRARDLEQRDRQPQAPVLALQVSPAGEHSPFEAHGAHSPPSGVTAPP